MFQPVLNNYVIPNTYKIIKMNVPFNADNVETLH